MSVRSYEKYEDTGFDWLGSLPSLWRTVPFWALFRRTKRTGFPEAELLSVYRDHGVIRKKDRDDNFNNASEDLGTYQLVEPGDLAVNKMKAWQGSLGISPHRGIVSPAYFVFQNISGESPAYLHYLLRSPPFAAAFMTISKGIRINQWDVDPDHLSQLPVPLPSLAEQAAIAAFLDCETGKIDALVDAQRRLIELLKEKRQAVISHAVTKGLDPSASMKDTEIEWLGKVPEHWSVVSMRRLLRRIEQGWSPQCDNRPAELYEWGILKSGCVNRGVYNENENKVLSDDLEPIANLEVFPGDLLMSRASGSPELLGSVAFVIETRPRIMISDKIFRLHVEEAVLPRWFALLMSSLSIRSQIAQAIGGADGLANNLSQASLLAFRCACPPMHEQAAIVARIEQEAAGLDALVAEAESAIALLQERRSALISAAVTGKLDVRGLAPVETVAA